MRTRLILKCEGCKNNNYIITKNKSASVTGKQVAKKYKKYCKFCRIRLYHSEEKMK